MKKVPNVNTHIFKQPGLPWQTATFSDDALAAFAKYDTLGDGLTDAEKTAMAAYIDAEVAAGNQSKKDYETIYSLSGNNALVDYIGGKVGINNGATLSVSGASFATGAEYIDSNYNGSSDAINYALNNAIVGVFLKATGALTGDNYIFDAAIFDSAFRNTAGTRKRGSLNNAGDVLDSTEIANEKMYHVGLDGVKFLATDGVKVTSAGSGVSIPNATFKVGGRGGVFGLLGGTISVFFTGAGVGFDLSANNINVRTLLTALGAI